MNENNSFRELIEYANHLVELLRDQKYVMQEMRRIYLLEWGESLSDKAAHIRETRDTQPYDAVNWAVDVLSSNPPSFSIEIPRVVIQTKSNKSETEKVRRASSDIAGLLENVVRAAFAHNDSRRMSLLLRDIVTSLFLYDMAVVKVADMRNTMRWKGSPLERMSKSPFVVRACDPCNIFYTTDEMGLSAVLQRYTRSIREVRSVYGDRANGADTLAGPDGNVVFCEWWERGRKAAWIERPFAVGEVLDGTERYLGFEHVLEDEENKLGFIPYVIRTGRGVQLFDDPTSQIMPLLYGGWKSKIFYRANLFLSIVSTLAFAMANPQYVYMTADGRKTLDIDFSQPGVYSIQTGESLQPLAVGVNRDLYEVLQLVLSKSEQTTMPKVLAGQSPGGVTAAAAINLLVQGGKLNVNPIQSAVGELYNGLIALILEYIRVNKSPIAFISNDTVEEVTADDIPQWLDIKTVLRADMPQDKSMLYNIAIQAWKSAFVSKETAWEIAGIEDKVREQARLDEEKAMQVVEDGGQMPMPSGGGMQGMPGQMLPQQAAPEVSASPSPSNPILDALNAQQNAQNNPMEDFV